VAQKTKYGGKCPLCNQDMKLLFTSWFCDCANPNTQPLLGYCLVSQSLLSQLDGNVVPAGTTLYLFRNRDDADTFVQTYLSLEIIEINLTLEPHIVWSSLDEFTGHIASRSLPYKLVQ
jgi:hypothetical protein